jgi:hypothetical protein
MREMPLVFMIAVAAAAQVLAASEPDAGAILERAFDNYRAGSSASSVAMTVPPPGLGASSRTESIDARSG